MLAMVLYVCETWSLTLREEHKVEEDEVGGTCGTNGSEEERV
jgi:hypothetical protein